MPRGKKATATVTKKGQESERVEVEAEVMTPAETALIEVKEVGITDLDQDLLDKEIGQLEKLAMKYYRSRVDDEVKLSFTLFALKSKEAHLDRGFDERDYYDKHLGISYTKAKELIANAQFLIDVGITNLKRLIGMSWPKLKLLRKPVEMGVIGKKGIDAWIEKCKPVTEKGDGVLERDLERMIKDLIAKKAKVEVDDTLKTISFKVPAYSQEIVNRFEEIAEKAVGGDRGNWFLQALIEFASTHVNKSDVELARAKGLASLKEMAEKIAPIACFFVPLTDNLSADVKLGIVSKIFQGYGESPNSDGVKELRFCLAGTEKEAEKYLGVKEIRTFDIGIAKSLRPEKLGGTPSVEETEKGDDKKEDKPKPKGKDKDKDKKEEPEVAADMSEDDMKAEIKRLVAKSKISKEAYQKKKEELLKDHEKGPALTSAMLEWLRSVK